MTNILIKEHFDEWLEQHSMTVLDDTTISLLREAYNAGVMQGVLLVENELIKE